jgi:hypothetical protein
MHYIIPQHYCCDLYLIYLCWLPTIRSCDTCITERHNCSSSSRKYTFPFTPGRTGPPSWATLGAGFLLVPPTISSSTSQSSKKSAHLQNPRCPPWKKSSRQPAGQGRWVGGAGLEIRENRSTVGTSWNPGPRWGPLASPLAPRVAMLLTILKRGNHCIQAHLSSILHKSLKTICNPKVSFFS